MVKQILGLLAVCLALVGCRKTTVKPEGYSWAEQFQHLQAAGKKDGSAFVMESLSALKIEVEDGTTEYFVSADYRRGDGTFRNVSYNDIDVPGTLRASQEGGSEDLTPSRNLTPEEHQMLRQVAVSPREADQRAMASGAALDFRTRFPGEYKTDIVLIAQKRDLPDAIQDRQLAWRITYEPSGTNSTQDTVIWVDARTGEVLGHSTERDINTFQPAR